MRIGTVLRYETAEYGKSYGVVNSLIDVNSVKVNDINGGEYIVHRGQGHKVHDQNSELCQSLRNQFGITVGPCQKEAFGVEAVREAAGKFVELCKNPTFQPGQPRRVVVAG